MGRVSRVMSAVAVAALLGIGSRAQGAEARPEKPRLSGVSIYLLKDPKLDARQAAKGLLAALPLREAPWIASANIERYDASTHFIHLKQPVRKARQRILLRGTPFVVTVDGERRYLGALTKARG